MTDIKALNALIEAAGATITDPGALAFLSLLAGGVFGGVAVAAMAFDGVKLNMTIGRKGGDQ